MIVPTSCAVDEAGGVETANQIRQAKLGISLGKLAPSFIINNLTAY